jgi:hypothetical protein
VLLVAAASASAQSFLNGSFEANSATGCEYNLTNPAFNGLMANVTAFGSANETDIHTWNCYVDPQHGDWCVGLSHPLGVGLYDAIALELSAPLKPGWQYTLTFWDHKNTSFGLGDRDLEVGVSTDGASFGMLVGTVTPVADTWTQRQIVFDAPVAATHVTVRVADTSAADSTWVQVDDFSLSGIVAVNEVDCDSPGPDTRDFIELYDGGAGGVALTDYVLVLYDGDTDAEYASFDLDVHVTNSGGFFVAGQAAVGPDLDIGGTAIQNGADAVALYSYAGPAADFAGTFVANPPAGATLIDALVYDTGQADDGGLLAALTPGQPQADEAAGGSSEHDSNQRCPDGAGGAGNTQSYAQIGPSPAVLNYRCAAQCSSSASLIQREWKMVSLACDEGVGATVGTVFGDDLSGAYGTDWLVWERDEVNDQYVFLDLLAPVQQGPSYWIVTTWAAEVFGTQGGYPLTSEPYPVPLTADPAGRMNMVGNPFLFHVDAADLLVDTGSAVYPWGDVNLAGVIDSTLWSWNGSAYQSFNGGAIPGTLDTSGGIWSRVYQPCTLLIPPNPASQPGGGPLSGTGRGEGGPMDGWWVRLEVRSDTHRDPGNFLGRLTGSLDGPDRNDLEELEPFAEPYLTLVVPHPEWGRDVWSHTTDIRQLRPGAGGIWNLEVRSDLPRPVTLSWQVDGAVHDILERSVLRDEETGATVAPSPGGSFSVQMVAPIHRLTWWVNSTPRVDAGRDREVETGEAVEIVAPFWDEDPEDEHQATIDWGDGSVSAGHVDPLTHTVSGGHVFEVSGDYTVEVCVEDPWGGRGCDTAAVRVSPPPALIFADGFESGDSSAWAVVGP